MTPFVKYLLTWAAGFLIGAGVVCAMAKPVLDRAAATVAQLSDQIQDLDSAGTVLYEDSVPCGPGKGLKIPILNGGTSITIGDDTFAHGRSARWYIPMKVTPQRIILPFNGSGSFAHIKVNTQKDVQ